MLIVLSVCIYLHSQVVSIPVLNELNFLLEPTSPISLRCVEKSAPIIDASSTEEKTHYKVWERSNSLSLMFMQMSIANNIKSSLPKTESGIEFMKFVEEHYQTVDKSLAGTLMSTLTTMKFDGSHTMQELVIKMTNITARLKSLRMTVNENFLVQFILNSLSSEYGPF